MKIISERGKAENIYKSYQKEEKPLTLTNENKSAKSGNSKKTARTTEKDTSKSKAAPNMANKDEQEQGHEMTPSQKRVDVEVAAKPSYGPIQEMPTVQERIVEISIDDAIGKSRCVHH
jgi:hypothetical protein